MQKTLSMKTLADFSEQEIISLINGTFAEVSVYGIFYALDHFSMQAVVANKRQPIVTSTGIEYPIIFSKLILNLGKDTRFIHLFNRLSRSSSE